MKTIPALLLSLSLCAAAWALFHAADVGVRVTVLHIIASPKEVAK